MLLTWSIRPSKSQGNNHILGYDCLKREMLKTCLEKKKYLMAWVSNVEATKLGGPNLKR